VDESSHGDLKRAAAEMELLLFGASDRGDDVLAQKLGAAAEPLTAYLLARLAREPVRLH
jgi:hypothetical protein